MKNNVTVIRVELLGLADLLVYLREKDAQQKKIDALAVKVEQLSTELSQSSTALKGAVDKV